MHHKQPKPYQTDVVQYTKSLLNSPINLGKVYLLDTASRITVVEFLFVQVYIYAFQFFMCLLKSPYVGCGTVCLGYF